MATTWSLYVYRKLCEIDIASKRDGNYGLKRFEHLVGTEAEMRAHYADFAKSDQVLAVELISPDGNVALRHDLLLDVAERIESQTDWLLPVVKAVLEHRIMTRSLP